RATGHQHNPSWKSRQRLLARGVKQALCGQPLAKLSIRQLQRADTARLDFTYVKLIPARFLENLDCTSDDYFHSVIQGELQPLSIASPHHTAQFAESILERQVQVPAAMSFYIADLTDHVYRRRDAAFNRPFDQPRKLTHSQWPGVARFWSGRGP